MTIMEGAVAALSIQNEPSPAPPSPEQMESSQNNSNPSLLGLPNELTFNILSYLSPLDLASVSQTCRALRDCAFDNQLWALHFCDILPQHQFQRFKQVINASNSLSTRNIYASLHPFWFLPKHRVWYSNEPHTGKLLLALYSHRRQCIEAYVLTAVLNRNTRIASHWSHNPEVMMLSFEPTVLLVKDQPKVRIHQNAFESRVPLHESIRDLPYPPVQMDVGLNSPNTPTLLSKFMLCTPLGAVRGDAFTQPWPPQHLPAASRCDSETMSYFDALPHSAKLSDISQHNFRVVTALSFGVWPPNGLSMPYPTNPVTYATLPREAYTPTKAKPWKGIWVGDYGGHGCEFLVVLQPEGNEVRPLPQNLRSGDGLAEMWADPGEGDEDVQPTDSDSSAAGSLNSDSEGEVETGEASGSGAREKFKKSPWSGNEIDEEAYEGRIEAIKLTGDENVPRTEYTFIAPDIGEKGTVRIANEKEFPGARIVKCYGHIAARGFRNDGYLDSQLILISPNKIAQYWKAMGHISYYERVDIDRILEQNSDI